jgi:hypothetical protein
MRHLDDEPVASPDTATRRLTQPRRLRFAHQRNHRFGEPLISSSCGLNCSSSSYAPARSNSRMRSATCSGVPPIMYVVPVVESRVYQPRPLASDRSLTANELCAVRDRPARTDRASAGASLERSINAREVNDAATSPHGSRGRLGVVQLRAERAGFTATRESNWPAGSDPRAVLYYLSLWSTSSELLTCSAFFSGP